MKYPLLYKATVLGLVLSASAMTASAQKIEEKDLKVNIGKIANSTAQLQKLEPVTYTYATEKYKDLKLPSGSQYGFLAGNVQTEFPGMIYEASKNYSAGKNDSRALRYDEVRNTDLIPVLVAAIKEQQAQIERLQKELELLKMKSSK